MRFKAAVTLLVASLLHVGLPLVAIAAPAAPCDGTRISSAGDHGGTDFALAARPVVTEDLGRLPAPSAGRDFAAGPASRQSHPRLVEHAGPGLLAHRTSYPARRVLRRRLARCDDDRPA
jgi:hypothetical protein